MKGVDTLLGELLHLPGGDGGRDQLAGLSVVVEAFELLGEPGRHGGAGAGHEIPRLLEIMHRHDAGHDRDIDAAGADPIEITQIKVVIEEHLGDGAGRPGIDLGLQRVDVGVEIPALGMLLRIGRDRNLEIGITLLDAGDQVGRALIAVGMRLIGRADAGGGIAAQRHDVADADLVIARDHVVDLALRCADAGQMRGRRQIGLFEDAGDGRMGALAGRSPGAIGHRHEIGGKRRQPVDGFPERALHLL